MPNIATKTLSVDKSPLALYQKVEQMKIHEEKQTTNSQDNIIQSG